MIAGRQAARAKSSAAASTDRVAALPAKTTDRSSSLSLWLDAFRWMACLIVLLTHARNRLLISPFDLPAEARSLAHYGIQFVAGFGQQALMVFFVLSGYLVGGSVYREFRKTGDINIPRYMTNRLVRLCLVLWPVFLLGGALDLVGATALGGLERGIYEPDILSRLDPSVLACNVLFLQNFECWQLGTNGAIWSLSIEFWHYVFWPLFLLAFLSAKKMSHRVFMGGLLIGLAAWLTSRQFTGAAVVPYMSMWVFGVWASSSRSPLIRSALAAALVVVGYLLAVRMLIRVETIVYYEDWGLPFVLDVGIGFVFANLLLTLRHAGQLAPPPGGRLHAQLAAFTFSLYCLHTPVLHFYGTVVTWFGLPAWKMTPTEPIHWLILTGGIALPILSAWALSKVTEAKTEAVRDWIFRRTSAWRGVSASQRP